METRCSGSLISEFSMRTVTAIAAAQTRPTSGKSRKRLSPMPRARGTTTFTRMTGMEAPAPRLSFSMQRTVVSRAPANISKVTTRRTTPAGPALGSRDRPNERINAMRKAKARATLSIQRSLRTVETLARDAELRNAKATWTSREALM